MMRKNFTCNTRHSSSFEDLLKEKLEFFRRVMLVWYVSHGDKDLPWRKRGDAWAVLVAGILLRKTSAKQVARIYEKFLELYPTPQKLLNATEEEVRNLIRPLGLMNQRAKQLIELAKVLVTKYDGKVPCSEDDLKALPGIGDYIASEVLLATCNEPRVLLDTNVIRVLHRVFGIKPSSRQPYRDHTILQVAKKLIVGGIDVVKQLNYAILDFARKVCSARNPKCNACPARSICSYYADREGIEPDSIEFTASTPSC